MWHVTVKNLLSRKLRLVTTSLAIAIGVAFVAGAYILGATINKTFDDLFSTAFKNTDAVVRGPKVLEVQGNSVRSPIAFSLVDTVKTVPGVVDAQPYFNGTAQVVGSNGKVIGTGGAPSFGNYWDPNPKLNSFQIVEGAAPSADNEVVVDKGTASKGKLHIGDSVKVLTARATETFRVGGIAKFGQVDSPGGSTNIFFTLSTSQRLLADPGEIDSIAVLGVEGESQQALVDRISAKLSGTPVDVVTGTAITKEFQNELKDNLGFITTFLSIFGFITLFVGAFIINNTFSILLAQRLKETALLRAIGAQRRQVLTSMMVEAVAVGLIASIIGVGLGVLFALGIKALLSAWGVSIASANIVIPSSALIIALVAGVGITFVSSVLPARRGSKVPPLAAMRDVAFDTSNRSVMRLIFGLLILVLGAAALAYGLLSDADKAYIPVGIGAALVFIGVGILGPIIARPASWLLGLPLVYLKGTTGNLARENALRNPRRTAATASALMIGVALVTLASVLFTSIKASTNAAVDRAFHGDFIIQSGNNGETGVSTNLAKSLRQSQQIGTVAELRFPPVEIDGTTDYVSVLNGADFSKLFDLDVAQGNLSNLNATEFAASQDYVDQKHWALGHTVKVQYTKGQPQELKLAVIYKDKTAVNDLVFPTASADASGAEQVDSVIFVAKASGASIESARNVIETALTDYPNASVQDQTEFKESISSQIDTALNFFYGLLALAVIIALIGIANTLALSVLERTREIGLMRAVGMTRRQVRSMVRWESVIVALLGTFLGLVIGVAFGWALVSSLGSEGVDILSIPVGTLVVIVLVAAVAGVLAAILPARRAARLNVLQAIVTE